MPEANSSPVRPAACAAAATRLSDAPACAETTLPSTRTSLIRSPSAITSPRMPPSRTIRFDPLPSTSTGTPSARAASIAATTCPSLSGKNIQSAGPPMRNVVCAAIGSSRSSCSGAANRIRLSYNALMSASSETTPARQKLK